MGIIAIGNEQIVKEVQARAAEQSREPRDKLIDAIKASAGDETLETWQHHAAEIQDIGAMKVRHFTFELFGKICPKNMTALKQKLVAVAVAECVEKMGAKHYFEGENLERTMKRIGAIYLLAQKVDRKGYVQYSFRPVLEGHGVMVPDWLKLELNQAAPKHEEHRRSVHHERPRRSAEEMFRVAPERIPLVVRADGSVYQPKAKHKPIVPLSDEERAANEKKRAEEEAKRAAAKAAKAEAMKAKAKNKKQGGKKK